jgi:hypothetical protein
LHCHHETPYASSRSLRRSSLNHSPIDPAQLQRHLRSPVPSRQLPILQQRSMQREYKSEMTDTGYYPSSSAMLDGGPWDDADGYGLYPN